MDYYQQLDLEEIPSIINYIHKTGYLKLGGLRDIELLSQRDICYINEKVNGKSGVIFEAYDSSKNLKKIHLHPYYSLHCDAVTDFVSYNFPPIIKRKAPFPYTNAAELLINNFNNSNEV